jgi:hypothetical protein
MMGMTWMIVSSDRGIANGFDFLGKVSAFVVEAVIQAVNAGINQTNHILGTGRIGAVLVFFVVKFPHEVGGIAVGQRAMPEAMGDVSGAGGHAGAFHEPQGGLQGHHHHGTNGIGIQSGNKRLVNPATRQSHPIGDSPNDLSQIGTVISVHAIWIVRVHAFKSIPPTGRWGIDFIDLLMAILDFHLAWQHPG